MASHDDSVSAETDFELGKKPVVEIEELIDRIQAKPELWDSRHPLFRNKTSARRAWNEIKQAFPGAEVEDLRKKWKNLKDGFRKEHRRIGEVMLSLEYPGINPDSTWRHYQSLQFLMEDDVYAASLKSLVRGKNQDDAKYSSGEDCEMKDVDSQDKPTQIKTYSRSNARTSPVPSPQTSESQAKTGTKKPNEIRAEFLEIEKKKLKILEEEIEKQKNEERNERSEDYHFLMSILPQMEKLNPVQKLRLRNKINQALLDELGVIKIESQEATIDLPQPQAYSDPQITFIDLPNTTTENANCKVEVEDSFF